MTVTVFFTTQIKAALERPSDQVELSEPGTVADVLRVLADRYGTPFRDLVFRKNDQLLPSVLLCLGDEQIDPSGDRSLHDGDVLTLLSAISGG